jgi:hypothetical protein
MKRERKDTRIHLVEEIESLLRSGAIVETHGIREILAEARMGEYHDYKNDKYACGKVEVVSRLRKEGLLDLANRVIAGEFDEEADEDDKAMMRKDLPEAAWDIFGLRPSS